MTEGQLSYQLELEPEMMKHHVMFNENQTIIFLSTDFIKSLNTFQSTV